MTYDIFSFFYELDLLELRMNILNDYVDKFVIVEATESFMGEKKPLYFEKNKARFSKWKDKIIHYIVDDYPNDKELMSIAISSPAVGAGEHWWVREFYQKESIKKALINLNDDDICILCDVDEVWNPNIKYNLNTHSIYRPILDSYMYYLNYRSSAHKLMWTGPSIMKYSTLKNGVLNHLRNRNMTSGVEIDNGGWHYEALGGAMDKISIVKHPDYYNSFNMANSLEHRINSLLDYKGRGLSFWIEHDISKMPEYIRNNDDSIIKKLTLL